MLVRGNHHPPGKNCGWCFSIHRVTVWKRPRMLECILHSYITRLVLNFNPSLSVQCARALHTYETHQTIAFGALLKDISRDIKTLELTSLTHIIFYAGRVNVCVRFYSHKICVPKRALMPTPTYCGGFKQIL